jgi:hypothetical protein
MAKIENGKVLFSDEELRKLRRTRAEMLQPLERRADEGNTGKKLAACWPQFWLGLWPENAWSLELGGKPLPTDPGSCVVAAPTQ